MPPSSPAGGRLVIHGWVPGGWLTLAAAATISLVVPLLVFQRAMAGRLYPGALVRLLVFRPFWYLQLLVPILGPAGLLGGLAGLLFGVGGRATRYSVAVAAGLLAVVGLAGWIGSRMLVTRRVEAVFPELPEGLDGLTIVQVSDLHVGPHTSRRHLARVRSAIERAGPDVIVFTGDQVDDYPRDTEPFARAFARLRAPLGVFAVAGNHDIYAGWPAPGTPPPAASGIVPAARRSRIWTQRWRRCRKTLSSSPSPTTPSSGPGWPSAAWS